VKPSLFAKKQKLDNVISSVAKVVRETKTRAPMAAKISAKQLKGFHFLLSAASYVSVLEGTQMGKSKTEDNCFRVPWL
jgi:hypothetical protein